MKVRWSIHLWRCMEVRWSIHFMVYGGEMVHPFYGTGSGSEVNKAHDAHEAREDDVKSVNRWNADIA
jgi:hypothetical protein